MRSEKQKLRDALRIYDQRHKGLSPVRINYLSRVAVQEWHKYLGSAQRRTHALQVDCAVDRRTLLPPPGRRIFSKRPGKVSHALDAAIVGSVPPGRLHVGHRLHSNVATEGDALQTTQGSRLVLRVRLASPTGEHRADTDSRVSPCPRAQQRLSRGEIKREQASGDQSGERGDQVQPQVGQVR